MTEEEFVEKFTPQLLRKDDVLSLKIDGGAVTITIQRGHSGISVSMLKKFFLEMTDEEMIAKIHKMEE